MPLVRKDKASLPGTCGSSEFQYTSDLTLKKAPRCPKGSNLSGRSFSNKAQHSSPIAAE